MIQIPGLENYYGGKGASGTPQTIINQIPPHIIYIEPFLGGGKIMCYKKPALFNWGLDLNKEVINLWLKVKLDDTYLISHFNGIQLLKDFTKDKNNYIKPTYIYLDPPYLLDSRKSSKKQYKYELTKDQHIQILQTITTINKDKNLNNIFIGISCLKNDLYKEYLSDWRLLKFWNQTRRGKQLEYLYMNYPEPTVLHQYNYLGKDYREREKIQNQIKRNVDRLKNMNPTLRNAIVTAINEEITINN